MKELTALEYKMIGTIASFYPYATEQVEQVYQRCSSFDNTIRIIEESLRYGVSLNFIMNYYYGY